ncbi:hypothetical protein NDU88_004372 [Pleurodeles waltl]|uniref:Uncharacterized protein n=1 Tax=Pleurodeles waltl TaxID=8319 RepID=A0AAV7W6F9_PLEWA|nr:hypothetical protein NDU88_004372 [Pleurodeles waltl]
MECDIERYMGTGQTGLMGWNMVEISLQRVIENFSEEHDKQPAAEQTGRKIPRYAELHSLFMILYDGPA